MKICLYSPYIPKHLGGGERYLLDVARVLAQRHKVSIAVPAHYAGDPSITDRYEQFLDLKLDAISFIPSPLGSTASAFQKLWWTRQFDLMYYVTDGSLFFSLARKNILHIQFPLRIRQSGLIKRAKLRNWQIKNTNSEFTKQVVEQSWPVDINLVHHPMVEVERIHQHAAKIPKEKIILSVGRFFRHLHSKRQDVLVDVFRELTKQYPEQTQGWKVVFIGAVEDQEYLTHIKRKKRGLPVEFYHNLSREELLSWYARASIYWHAAGYNVDERQHPEKVEHFGISTAEAMAAGCIPLVVGKGGQKEVLGPNLARYMWQTTDECVQKTVQEMTYLETQNTDTYQQQFIQQVRRFGRPEFARKLWEMVGS